MKKFLLSIVACVFAMSLNAQNVARECVLFEVFTGVNCPYCPAAANGIVQLLEEGYAIAPVAIHTNAFSTAEFYTAETNARASYYGVTSYPTLKADGVISVSGGGSASESMYSSYLSRYNQRINIPSPFTIDLSYQVVDNQLQAVVTVNQVGECGGTDVRVFIALTQSHIQRNWQGMSELNAVCRDLMPTQNGTAYTGGMQTVVENFSIAGYPREDCHLVAWVQNYSGSSKEVYQAKRIALGDTVYPNDIVIGSVSEYAEDNCSGVISPLVSVKSMGEETLNSMDIVAYGENGEELTRYAWTGNISHGESETVQMPEFNFGDNSVVTFVAEKPNGQDDGFAADNINVAAFAQAKEIDGYIKMSIKTGKDAEDLTVNVINTATGEELYHFAYEQSSHVFNEEMSLPEGCYRMTFHSASGIGLGNAFFQLTDSNNEALYTANSNTTHFIYNLSYEFNSDGTFLAVSENPDNDVNIFPNPVNGFLKIEGENVSTVEIYNVLGEKIMSMSYGGENEVILNADNLKSGVYFVRINGETTRHFIKR